MVSVMKRSKQRNWVAKNNFNRPVRHRDPTQYRRNEKHKVDYAKEASNGEK
jgi:hypothetical protein